jgi:hypothetical protein
MSNETDTAGVMFIGGVVQTLCVHMRSPQP